MKVKCLPMLTIYLHFNVLMSNSFDNRTFIAQSLLHVHKFNNFCIVNLVNKATFNLI